MELTVQAGQAGKSRPVRTKAAFVLEVRDGGPWMCGCVEAVAAVGVSCAYVVQSGVGSAEVY